MALITLKIITPQSILFDGDCVQVDLPGSEGRFGVLSGHTSFIAILDEGEIEIFGDSGAKPLKFHISEGCVDVTPQMCKVLIEEGREVV